jgi:hypothetical protein
MGGGRWYVRTSQPEDDADTKGLGLGRMARRRCIQEFSPFHNCRLLNLEGNYFREGVIDSLFDHYESIYFDHLSTFGSWNR